jgi:hypothetical protein
MTFDLKKLIINAATIGELLSTAYRPGIAQKDSTEHSLYRRSLRTIRRLHVSLY